MMRRYYEDELHYLHEAGKEFARVHPAQARYLNIESVADRDPYVERLFEGFAFLTGKVRERLDDELPEYTEALFGLLWPHYLRPIPSISLIQFSPKPGLVQKTTLIPSGTEIRSGPVGEEGTVCRFRTTNEVHLQPVKLVEAQPSWSPDGTSSVTLRFQLEKGIEYSALTLSPLRIWFHAEDTVASLMHLFFTRHVSRVVIISGDVRAELQGQKWVRPGGLGPDEGLLPYSMYSFSGIRHLQEYLSFRRKFWCADLLGFNGFVPPAKTPEFQIQVFFDSTFPEEKRFKTENIRLFCTPVVNLFRADTEPIRVDHKSSEYRLIADVRHPKSVFVYSVDQVIGTVEGTGERDAYVPFFSYMHGENGPKRYFITSSRVGPSERVETYLMPGGYAVSDGKLPAQVLTVEATCTNGSIPREKLQERMITVPAPEFPNVATAENITQPTLDLQPPSGRTGVTGQPYGNFFWQLVSHLSFNHMSVATLESLRGLLELYDWTGTDANRRKIAGLRSVTWKPKEMLDRGAMLRGAEITIEVQDGHFADEGDLCLFGLTLSEFLAEYATINSFVHLVLVTKPSERMYRWDMVQGVQPLV